MRCRPAFAIKSKHVYRQKDEADWVAAMKAHEIKLYVYHCPDCLGYHLTKKPQRNQELPMITEDCEHES